MGKRKPNIFTKIGNAFKSAANSVKNFSARQAHDASENTRIFAIKKDLSRYESDNSKLRSNINSLNNNITYTINKNEPIVRRLQGEKNSLNYYTTLYGDEYNKLSKNAATANLRMSEIIGINDELQKNTIEYKLADINTKKNIYNLIKTENNLITKNNLVLIGNINKNNQEYTYSVEQYNEIEFINTLFFVLYYFLFIVFLFSIIFKTKYSIIIKLFIVILFLLYPYIIYIIETLIYNIIYLFYSYIFSIFSIEEIN